jgi:DNA-binding FrmR family transcriptional regulator
MHVLKQVAATAGATRSLGITILEEHLKGCVVGAIKNDKSDEDLIHQVIQIFNKFSK